MNYETAALTARYELAEVSRRAELMGSLGKLPSAPALFPIFRRRAVMPLNTTVEIVHADRNEKARIARRLREVSVHAPMSERKAS